MRARRRADVAEATALGASRSAAAEAEARRLREAIEHLPVGVVVVDEHGMEVARNARASAFVGERPTDLLVADVVRQVLATGRDERVVELLGPPARVLRVVAQPLPSGGTVAFVDDESERARVDAVRRDFVANVSHELRTPIGALSVLAETMADEDDPGVLKRLANRLAGEADRAAALVADLLDLSRIEAAPLPMAKVRIDEVVDSAVEVVQPIAERASISVEVAAGPAVSVRGDRDQLVSAVSNLLHNAVHYSDADSRVDVSYGVEGGWLSVAVRDRGIGIPAKDLERVFERFYRVDRARSRRTGGTGLGLAIVRHVATNHGGDVEVSSSEGEGSVFTLRLPVDG
ncbi:MAG TPA: ATP-binding protein [Acidimicrobiales bacterium]|nr:ATP-binding protein [Acidimicrobiales bacterium]